MTLGWVNDDTVVSLGGQIAVSIWRLSNREVRAIEVSGDGRAIGIISPNGRRLALKRPSDPDLTLAVYDLDANTPKLRAGPTIQTSGKPIALGFSADGSRLAVGQNGGFVTVYHAGNGEAVFRTRLGTGPIRPVALSSGGRMLAAAARDQGVAVYSVETGRCLSRWLEDSPPSECLAFSPDEQWLAVGLADGTARLCRLDRPDTAWIVATGELRVRQLAFTPDGSHLATVSPSHDVKLWSIPELPRLPKEN